MNFDKFRYESLLIDTKFLRDVILAHFNISLCQTGNTNHDFVTRVFLHWAPATGIFLWKLIGLFEYQHVSWLGEPKPFMTSSQAFYKNFSSKSDWLIWLSVPIAIGGRNNSRFKLLTRLLFSWRFTYLTIKSAFSWSNLFWSSINSWTFSRNCSSVYKRGDNIRNKNT